MAIYITQFRTNADGHIKMTYKESADGELKDADKTTIDKKEQAVEELYRILADLRDAIPELIELPDEYSFGMQVRGFDLDYVGDDNLLAASLYVHKYFKNRRGKMEIKTPMTLSAERNKGDVVLPTDVLQKIERLHEICEHYIAGERADIPLELDKLMPPPFGEVTTIPTATAHADSPAVTSTTSTVNAVAVN